MDNKNVKAKRRAYGIVMHGLSGLCAALTAALSFASGAMLYVVFGELLPEAVRLWEGKAPALAAVVGIIVGMVITCW